MRPVGNYRLVNAQGGEARLPKGEVPVLINEDDIRLLSTALHIAAQYRSYQANRARATDVTITGPDGVHSHKRARILELNEEGQTFQGLRREMADSFHDADQRLAEGDQYPKFGC